MASDPRASQDSAAYGMVSPGRSAHRRYLRSVRLGPAADVRSCPCDVIALNQAASLPLSSDPRRAHPSVMRCRHAEEPVQVSPSAARILLREKGELGQVRNPMVLQTVPPMSVGFGFSLHPSTSSPKRIGVQDATAAWTERARCRLMEGARVHTCSHT